MLAVVEGLGVGRRDLRIGLEVVDDGRLVRPSPRFALRQWPRVVVHFANEDMFVGTAGETTATLVPRPGVAAALAVVIMLGYAPARPCDAAAQHAPEIGRRGPAT